MLRADQMGLLRWELWSHFDSQQQQQNAASYICWTLVVSDFASSPSVLVIVFGHPMEMWDYFYWMNVRSCWITLTYKALKSYRFCISTRQASQQVLIIGAWCWYLDLGTLQLHVTQTQSLPLKLKPGPAFNPKMTGSLIEERIHAS